ncbi:MAG: hypothetical protein WBZ11_13110 [Candidatus Sulfotelmatobacter sp.]
MKRSSLQLRWFMSIFCLVVSAFFSHSLEAATDSQSPPVHMVVTVEALHGSEVPEVGRRDVMVLEKRNRDQVTDWVPAQGDNAALELFILMDDSSNMSLGTQLDDLRKFIDSQPASTKIGVAYMQNGMAKMQQNLTADHALAAKALRLPAGLPGINGSPYFSLSDLVKRWPETAARREVLMVSDGIDRYYGQADLQDPYLNAAIDDAQRANIVVYAIYTPGAGHYGHDYWQSYWGQIYLSKLADETGGEGYYIGFQGPPVSFAPYLKQMDGSLSHQYLLTFIPRPQKKSGLQSIKLTTEVSNAELVGPHKVYVQAAAP